MEIMEKKNDKIKRISFNRFAGIVGIVLMVSFFVGGFYLGHSNLVNFPKKTTPGVVKNADAIPDYLTKDVDFKEFWDIWQYVKSNYVKSDVADTKLFYGAISGMVSSLDDPYSVFFDPQISSKFEEELSGSFEGIGAEIGIRDNHLTVIAPLPGTPADKAGIKAGDFILSIDGKDTSGIALDYAVSIIRGKKGTPVKLSVYTEGDDAPRDVEIVRDKIEIDSVKFSQKLSSVNSEDKKNFEVKDGDIAYVQLLYFNENTLADWNKTIEQVVKMKPKGIILDLRNNPGGYLTTAIEIAGDWVNGRDVVMEQSRSGERTASHANHVARLANIPTVVLVNGGSASGSEIVAGALQDYKMATLVGEKTFGKGSVQDLKNFPDGSSVKLTIAEWLTPLGRNINKEGIAPDVEIKLTKEDVEADRDPQLDKALEILKSDQSK